MQVVFVTVCPVIVICQCADSGDKVSDTNRARILAPKHAHDDSESVCNPVVLTFVTPRVNRIVSGPFGELSAGHF